LCVGDIGRTPILGRSRALIAPHSTKRKAQVKRQDVVEKRINCRCAALATVRDYPDILGDIPATTGVPSDEAGQPDLTKS
jgi:hypothetical protein